MAAYLNTNFATFIGQTDTLTITPTVAGAVTSALTFVATPADGSGTSITKSTGAGTITTDVNGVATVAIAAADTVNRSPTVFRWRLWYTDVGEEQVLGAGTWLIKA